MKLALLLLTSLVCGCAAPKICGTTNGTDCEGEYLHSECLDYLKNKNDGYQESSHIYAIPIISCKNTIRKDGNQYIQFYDGEMIFGLLLRYTYITYFDENGKKTAQASGGADILNGLFISVEQSISPEGSYESGDFLSGLVCSSKHYQSKDKQIEYSKSNYLLNAFGRYSDGNSEYIKLFWITFRTK